MPTEKSEQLEPKPQEKAPEEMFLDSALVTERTLRDSVARPSRRRNRLFTASSYADSGLDAYSREDERERLSVGEGVKQTLLKRMRAENEASVQDAGEMKAAHEAHRMGSMKPAVDSVKQQMVQYYLSYGKYMVARSRVDQLRAQEALEMFRNTAGNLVVTGDNFDALRSMIKEIRANANGGNDAADRAQAIALAQSAKQENDKDKQEASDAYRRIRQVAEEWKEELKKYHNDTYLPRSHNYDRLFEVYYAMARDVTRSADEVEAASLEEETTQPEQEVYVGHLDRPMQDPRLIADVKKAAAEFNEVDSNKKDIKEYVGVYKEDDINSFAVKVKEQPEADLNIGFEPSKKQDAGSSNILDNETMIKSHTNVTLEAFGEGGQNFGQGEPGQEGSLDAESKPVQRVRVKINSNFEGYVARRQYAEDGSLSASGPQSGGKAERKLTAMDRMNLVIDERGKNGELLYSKRSSKIYSPTGEEAGTTGFFINGMFVAANEGGVGPEDETESKTLEQTSIENMAKQEKLRNAIRRSDFFRHVNARNISYYSNYDGDKKPVSIKDTDVVTMAEREGLTTGKGLLQNMGQAFLSGGFERVAGQAGSMGSAGKEDTAKEDGKSAALATYSSFGSTLTAVSDSSKIPEESKRKIAYSAASMTGVTLPMAGEALAQEVGVIRTNEVGMILTITKTIKEIADAVNSYKKSEKKKEGYDTAFHGIYTGVITCLDSAMTWINGVTGFAGAAGLSADVVSSLTSAITIIQGAVQELRELFSSLKSAADYMIKDEADKNLTTAMSNATSLVGKAAAKNAQIGPTIQKVKEKAKESGAASVIGAVGDVIGIGGAATGSAIPVETGFGLSSQATSFISFSVGALMRLGGDIGDIGIILGDKSLAMTPGFDVVLKEETGIDNRHYIMDLLRIFMAIDSHELMKSTEVADKAQAEKLSKALFGEVVKKPDFGRILKAVDAPDNWRSVLVESIT